MPAPGEPYWLPEDTAKVFAWRTYERGLCQECRTRESDWLGPDGEPLSKPRVRFETRRWSCTGCGKLHVYRERVKGEIGDDEKQWVGLDFVAVSTNGTNGAAV